MRVFYAEAGLSGRLFRKNLCDSTNERSSPFPFHGGGCLGRDAPLDPGHPLRQPGGGSDADTFLTADAVRRHGGQRHLCEHQRRRDLAPGASWRQTGRNLPAGVCGTAIALDPRDSRKLWVGTAGKGLFFSSDGGRTFQSMRRGLETAQIGGLQFDPENPARLYAGAAEKGVYQWNAASRRWSRLPNPGLPAAGYTGILTLDPQHPSVLCASHLEKGIFRLDLEDTAP